MNVNRTPLDPTVSYALGDDAKVDGDPVEITGIGLATAYAALAEEEETGISVYQRRNYRDPWLPILAADLRLVSMKSAQPGAHIIYEGHEHLVLRRYYDGSQLMLGMVRVSEYNPEAESPAPSAAYLRDMSQMDVILQPMAPAPFQLFVVKAEGRTPSEELPLGPARRLVEKLVASGYSDAGEWYSRDAQRPVFRSMVGETHTTR